MVKQIFVNLPIKDLEKTKKFWLSLGFTFNPQFTDEKAGALVLGENIFVMLITEPFFKTFVKKESASWLSSSSKLSEVINAVSVNTKEEVDELIDKALAAGAVKYREADVYDWMYNRSFQDLDGHLWELVFMDMSKFPANSGASKNK